ncbi:MAG: DnaB-like helicase C-terminal domain-containing protein, partial [Planctomycetia bacterium]
MPTDAPFVVAADLMAGWRHDVLHGEPPPTFPIGLDPVDFGLGPGLLTLLGGAPGAGKTAFVMQAVLHALESTPTVRACVLNVEMPPAVLLERQLARLAGVDLALIRKRQLADAHRPSVEAAADRLAALADRLAFVQGPPTMDSVRRAVVETRSTLLVLDYIQRIAPADAKSEKTAQLEAHMTTLRTFAAAGLAVFVVAAVGRQKSDQGRSSYAGLNLASFRGSSELEYGADAAWLLAPDQDARFVSLACVKNRYGDLAEHRLRFDKPFQRFTVADDGNDEDEVVGRPQRDHGRKSRRRGGPT